MRASISCPPWPAVRQCVSSCAGPIVSDNSQYVHILGLGHDADQRAFAKFKIDIGAFRPRSHREKPRVRLAQVALTRATAPGRWPRRASSLTLCGTPTPLTNGRSPVGVVSRPQDPYAQSPWSNRAPTEITSHVGHTIFGIFHLLGHQSSQFNPPPGRHRRHAILRGRQGHQRPRRLAAQRINVALVVLLRLAGSLNPATVQAARLIRTLQTKDRPTKLRQRYREGQEDQLGALGLAVNVIVLWNTITHWTQRWNGSAPMASTRRTPAIVATHLRAERSQTRT